MPDSTQVKKIKCPYCGWVRSVPVDVIVDESTTDVVRGLGEELRKAGAKIKAMLADNALLEANAWLDMPKCPECGNVYRYNARTGEVSK